MRQSGVMEAGPRVIITHIGDLRYTLSALGLPEIPHDDAPSPISDGYRIWAVQRLSNITTRQHHNDFKRFLDVG